MLKKFEIYMVTFQRISKEWLAQQDIIFFFFRSFELVEYKDKGLEAAAAIAT